MKKKCDEKNRWRNRMVAFRMSPEEADQLDIHVKISGLTKQEYLIRRVLEKDVIVNGNPRVFKALRNQLESVLNELRRLEIISAENEELIEVICYISKILCELKESTNE